jgi:uncharacterized protein with PhoU and TrkA domain
VRERTGAAVVAVERGGQVVLQFPEDFLVGEDDAVFVCGTGASLELYMRTFRAAPLELHRGG